MGGERRGGAGIQPGRAAGDVPAGRAPTWVAVQRLRVLAVAAGEAVGTAADVGAALGVLADAAVLGRGGRDEQRGRGGRGGTVHVCPPPQPHLAGPVLARGAVGDAVRLQVQLPERHLLVLDAELPHAACRTWRCWGGWETRSGPPNPVPPSPPLTHEALAEPRLGHGSVIGVPAEVQLLVQVQPLELALRAQVGGHGCPQATPPGPPVPPLPARSR